MEKKMYQEIINKVWFSLIVDGCAKFYKRREILDKYVTSLKEEGFDVYFFNCLNWIDHSSFENEYMIKMGKESFGHEYSSAFPDGTGNVLVLQNYYQFFLTNTKEAVNIINTIREMSWQYLLFGKRLVVLLHSEDLKINQKNLEIGEKLIRWVDGDEPFRNEIRVGKGKQKKNKCPF